MTNRWLPNARAALLSLPFLLLVSIAHADDADLRARVTEAYEAARAETLREPLQGRLDAVWHTDVLLQVRPDPQLQWWADVRRPLLKAHQTYRLVDPRGPLYPLPEDPGTGMAKWYTYMRAPFGTPPSIAIRYITDYLGPEIARPEQGYILTHQLAVLEWSKVAGLELPPELWARKPILLQRIAEEHAKDHAFSDLFAERIFFLVAYGAPTDAELERSVRIIVDAQTTPGNWAPPPITLTYDGESHHTEVEPEHARKMSMTALAAYLNGISSDGGTATATGAGAETGADTDADTDTDAESGGGTAWWVLGGAALLAALVFLLRRLRG